jgi:hypothetical protein
MASRNTFVDQRHGIVYSHDKKSDTVEALGFGGYDVTEEVTPSLVERLVAQIGKPMVRVLLSDSPAYKALAL